LALVGADEGRYDPPQGVAGRRGFSRVSKVKITTWVDERTVSAIKGLAAQQGVSVSEMCAQMLRRGVEEDGGAAGMEVLLPAVRGAVRREVGRMSDRLAHLMVRSALEGATGRRLLFQLLAEEMGQEEANRRNRAAWAASVQSLKKPAEGLREVLGEAPADAAAADGEGTAG
jgi:hypothetical protein